MHIHNLCVDILVPIMSYPDSRTAMSKRLQKEGFVHFTGLIWSVNQAGGHIGENIDEKLHGVRTYQTYTSVHPVQVDVFTAVVITETGEIWNYCGSNKPERLIAFLEENFAKPPESLLIKRSLHDHEGDYATPIPVDAIIGRYISARARDPYVSFGELCPPDPKAVKEISKKGKASGRFG